MISRKQLEEIAATVQGIPIFGCLPRSTSEEAGVRYGDIVLSVNGVRTYTIDEYLGARSLRATGMELRIFRGGKELTLNVPFRVSDSDPEELASQLAEGRYLGKSDLPEAEKGAPS